MQITLGWRKYPALQTPRFCRVAGTGRCAGVPQVFAVNLCGNYGIAFRSARR